jgi:hypothetical protein
VSQGLLHAPQFLQDETSVKTCYLLTLPIIRTICAANLIVFDLIQEKIKDTKNNSKHNIYKILFILTDVIHYFASQTYHSCVIYVMLSAILLSIYRHFVIQKKYVAVPTPS